MFYYPHILELKKQCNLKTHRLTQDIETENGKVDTLRQKSISPGNIF